MENKIKWIVNLSAEKLVRYLLITAILTLFTMYKISQNETRKLQGKFDRTMEIRRIEDRQRTDSFNNIRKMDADQCNEKYESYLRLQLEKLEKFNTKVNQNIKKNHDLINRIKNGKK